jgi:hypothetical protein
MSMIATRLMSLEIVARHIGCLVRWRLARLMLLEIEVSRVGFRCRLLGSPWIIAFLWAITGGGVRP